MKKSIFALGLILSFSAFAELQPIPDYELSNETATMECKEGEVLERVLVGRYCVYRDPQYNTCMMWENLYRERCVPKPSIAE